MQEEKEIEEDFLECWSCGGDKVRLRIAPYSEIQPLYYGQCVRCDSKGLGSASREEAVLQWNEIVRSFKSLLRLLCPSVEDVDNEH